MRTSRTSSAYSRRPVRGATAITAIAASVLASLALAGPAHAQGDATALQTSVVSADPADFTPFVKDGVVESVVQVGNQIIIGGSFTQIIRGTTTFPRTSLASFNATTGIVSTAFAPTLDGEVTSLAVSADGQSIYAGGAFNTVNGVKYRKVVELNATTGAVVSTFKNPAFDGAVADVRRVDNTLWVAGKFTVSGTTHRAALVTLDATSGAVTPKSTVVFSGLHNAGTLAIREIAITPANDRLVAIGNFTTVDGNAREQAVLLDISGTSAVVSGWQTSFFVSQCNAVFDTYMRDVAISPDGTYAVFATTGAYRANTSCDSISRMEISGTSPAVTPTWVDYTGGDTTTALTIVGSVVYAGGHFRWLNNPSAADKTGQGAVARTGLAALNPVTGLPFTWNPTRDRGYGVYDFLATPTGLWVGSDTDNVGGEYHPRIAFFPLAGGATLPANAVGSVPGDVLSVGSGAVATDTVRSTLVNAAVVPGVTSAMTTSDTWSHARGAMLIDSTLYTAWDDGKIYASQVNGSVVGPRTEINLNAGPVCTTGGGGCAGAFRLDVASITGMFFDNSRMYYTMSNNSQLFYRYFEPQSGIVGATRFQATGGISTLNPSRVRGMFLAGGQLYFADSSTGRLNSIAFSGNVVGSTVTQVDATRDWRSRGLALRAQPPGNVPPTAVITSSCTFLSCSFSASSSSDSDGNVVGYSWSFSDGGSSSSVSTNHAYAAAGTYTVDLTVTDDDGDTGSVSKQVTVADVPTSNIAFRAQATAIAASGPAKITVPAGVQADDQLLLFVTANGSTTFTTPTGWTQVGEQADGSPDMVTRVYNKTALGSDAGSAVSVALGATLKTATTLLAYDGVDTTNPLVLASAAEPATSADHAAPAVAVDADASWVVEYWADKTAGTTSWSVPGSLSQRSVVLGSGSGQVGGTTADTAGPVPTGTFGAQTATSSTSGAKATSFSIALRPA
jgi:PKD repeat protein